MRHSSKGYILKGYGAWEVAKVHAVEILYAFKGEYNL